MGRLADKRFTAEEIASMRADIESAGTLRDLERHANRLRSACRVGLIGSSASNALFELLARARRQLGGPEAA